jgi:DUF1009 family protein
LPPLPAGPVAIIAGGGSLPVEVAQAARGAGREVFIVALRGFADKAVQAFPHAHADMLDPAGIIALLRREQAGSVVLAGAVGRPGPMAVASVFSAFRNRDEIARILSGGDDTLLRGVVRLLEDAGLTVVGAHEVAPALLAGDGPLGGVTAPREALADIALGTRLLETIGPFDIGQGCVVAAGRILAVEGPEGTDAMLERVAGLLKRRVRLGEGEHPVLIKGPKPAQDSRVDLPAIGEKTIHKAAAAGCGGIAVAAGGVVLIDRAELVAAADRTGLFIHGFAMQ